MPVDFSDPDWRILSYPFPHVRLSYHPRAADAFAGSNVGWLTDSHYLYGFATGETVTHMTRMDLASMEVLQEDINNFENKRISDRSLREKVAKWKKVIASRTEYLQHIFNTAVNSSPIPFVLFNAFGNITKFALNNALHDRLSEAERAQRQFVWDMGRECFNRCPAGLTRDEFVRKFNGKGGYNAWIVNWRVYLGEAELSTEVSDWLKTQSARFNDIVNQVAFRSDKKQECIQCKFQGCKLVQSMFFESILFYFANVRDGDTESFYRNFIVALLVSMQRASTMLEIASIKKYAERLPILTDEERARFHAYKFAINDHTVIMGNRISSAMIDCLLADKYNDLSYLSNVILKPVSDG